MLISHCLTLIISSFYKNPDSHTFLKEDFKTTFLQTFVIEEAIHPPTLSYFLLLLSYRTTCSSC